MLSLCTEEVSMLRLVLAADDRTHQQIARAAGIARTTLSKYIHSALAPTEAHLRSLARVLGVAPHILTAQIPRDDLIGAFEALARAHWLAAWMRTIRESPPRARAEMRSALDRIDGEPTPEDLAAMASRFGIDPAWLLTGVRARVREKRGR
jgi:transcriptional regulator with XRE-family HTH domain